MEGDKVTVCEFVDTCRKDRDLNIEFKATVLTKLENIEKSIEGLKSDGTKEQESVWNAIDRLRDDVKYIYLKMGLVSGAISLIVALIVSYAGRG